MSGDGTPSSLALGDRPWVAYVGPFPFPWGQASSRRVAGVAASILATGRDVVVVSGSEPVGTTLIEEHASGSRLWLVGAPDTAQRAGSLARQIALHVTSATSAVAWLAEQPVAPSHVIVYGGGASYALRCLRWAHGAGIPVIADVVEWYSPRQFRGGIVSPSYLSAHMALRLIYPQFDGTIAISEFLRRRLATPRTIVVPPTLEFTALDGSPGARSRSIKGASELTLCYFGSPGRKDLLPEIIRGFAIARAQKGSSHDMRLVIAGPSVDVVRGLLRAELPTGVEVTGHLPQEQVGALLGGADFSVLLRPVETYSNAGFPTKFVESLAHSTPVIANVTSDLSDYLVDGVTGLVVIEPTEESLARTIVRAMAMNAEDRERMRTHCREMAVTSFDAAVHVRVIDQLLSETAR